MARDGYNRVGTVREPGEYALRGGIVDVFPPGSEEPVRLGFEVVELLLRAEKFVARNFLFHGSANNGSVFDAEGFQIALPAFECLAVK